MSYTHSQGVPIQGTPVYGAPVQVGVPVAPSAPGFIYPDASNAAPIYPPLPTGYSPFQDKDVCCDPPVYMDITQYNPRYIQPYQASPIDESEVRSVVTKHVSGKVLYSSSAVQQMIYSNIDTQLCYLYKLETFSEKRETKWMIKPHDPCAPVDGPHNGPIPGPWDVVVLPSLEYKADKKKVTVPHSEHVQQCHKCCGRGNIMCKHCSGVGFKSCSSCGGSGVRSSGNPCTSCSSSGRDKCIWCSSHGHKKCDHCIGHGHLKYYIQLKATWSVQEDYYASNSCGLKEKILKDATGTKILLEDNVTVKPVLPGEFHDQGVTSASSNLIVKHGNNCPGEKIVKQRHSLTAIPVAIVSYTRKGVPGSFFVYGEMSDRKAHFDSYPSKNCCIS